jgi:hypothetical protein
MTFTIVAEFGYIANQLVMVRNEIVVIGWKRRKTFTKINVLICGLAIVCR